MATDGFNVNRESVAMFAECMNSVIGNFQNLSDEINKDVDWLLNENNISGDDESVEKFRANLQQIKGYTDKITSCMVKLNGAATAMAGKIGVPVTSHTNTMSEALEQMKAKTKELQNRGSK